MSSEMSSFSSDSSRLSDLLARASPELEDRYRRIEAKAIGDLLPFAQLPDFTDHGIKHAHSVHQRLSQLIPEGMATPLTPFELFAVLCAALLHDVGMAMTTTEHESSTSVRLDHYNQIREILPGGYACLNAP